MPKKTKEQKRPKQVSNQLSVESDNMLLDAQKKWKKKYGCDISKRVVTDRIVEMGHRSFMSTLK